MTKIQRRDDTPAKRYVVKAMWSQEYKRYFHSVIDTRTRHWARGTSGDGYDTHEEAVAVRDELEAQR